MIAARVTIPADGTAIRVAPPHAKLSVGRWQWTVTNTDSANGCELVASDTQDAGTGYPLAHGASWSSVANGTEQVWALTASGSAVVVAVTGTQAG